jgi:eukaryotic-like serine/threonine-protein kinase
LRLRGSGDQFGPYILREPLGEGPNGTVYRASVADTGREIALKVIALHADTGADDLLHGLQVTNQIRVAAGLRHPGIVRVHGTEAVEGSAVAEMEYVRGMCLRDLLAITGRLPPERAVAIVTQILDALAYAHARSVPNRNLKPTNVLIRHDGLALLTDFGMRGVSPAESLRPAIHAYAAPEELDEDAAADRRSDIWSIGVLLFQMLSGRLPFPVSDPHDARAWRRGIAAAPAVPLSESLPGLPDALQNAVARALERDPAARFQNARQVLDSLLATGLCQDIADNEDEPFDRQEETYRRIDTRLRAEVKPAGNAGLPDLVRAFSEANPAWDDHAGLLHYAGILEPGQPTAGPEPHAIALTDEEIDHLEEIETRLKSMLNIGDAHFRADDSVEEGTARGGVPASGFQTALSAVRQPRSGEPDGPAARPTEAPEAASLANPADGAELVFVPAGKFVMGSDGFSEDNSPSRVVDMDAYYIYRFPVTVAQYRHYCEETAYPMPHAYWPWESADPIVGVTWHEACAYCRWAGTRLPTEAQWEKAARGSDGRTFPWGDHFDQRSDHRLIPKNAVKTSPVGSCPSGASPYGVADLVGNIQQWCQDLYDDGYYKTAPASNPAGPASSGVRRAAKSGLVHKLFTKGLPQTSHAAEQRVVRGSSWKEHHESFAFVFRRDTLPPDVRLPWVGFRCVAAVPP